MLKDLLDRSLPLAGAPGVRCLDATLDSWRPTTHDIAASGAKLLAFWADTSAGATVLAAFAYDRSVLVLQLRLPSDEASYPSIADIFPAAGRMERAAADLTGIRVRDGDVRPWLRHSAWPSSYLPLAARADDRRHEGVPLADQYPFVRVSGDGVHEIPVGPVHAGIIEPGHFRFSIVGEKVLKLEERLGYVHKGIERLFTETKLLDGHRLAARVSGDSGVAYSWAYCQALEGMAGTVVPDRASWLRALALESERISNHLGDLGALGNDAGFAFGLAQFSRLKESWLRHLAAALGQRYLLDFVVPGGIGVDAESAPLASLVACARTIAAEAANIRTIYDEHAGLRDRFVGAGTVTVELAKRLGLIGLAGRASGQDFDLRLDLPCDPYTRLDVRKCGRDDGDVAARVAVRFEELQESLRLVQEIVERLPTGESRAAVSVPSAGSAGIGLVEGWRGPVMVALSARADGYVARCHPHDPSWQNWPVLEHAVIGNIVPDFPLINKSFNLSYSGHDL
ncbi:MAG TPA: NADH-quinone oxidoreductase subunit C [Gammaproteobacteria bacterium]|nr:NADH-quinone oxidoreductase subunit C [Gammaproteobacteria bacterium]